MNVGVNLLWLVPGEVGGSEEYLTRQLDALVETRPDIELTLFTVAGFSQHHPRLAAATRVIEAAIDGRSRPRRVLAEATWLEREARRSNVDFVHHGGGTLPMRSGHRAALTIHDLQYFAFPETFSRQKLQWLKRSVPRAAARADVVTTPSRFVADDVIARFGLDPERVVVVPNAAPLVGAVANAADLRARYDLPGKVVIYPAITYHHKNHVTLVRAFAELHRRDASRRLVLLGGRGPAEDELRAEIDRLGVSRAVVRPGRVPDSDRDGLYRIASVLAFPSRYEGFGVPVLEGFAHGVPVVAANATALPEAVGDAGLLLDPLSTTEWVEAIDDLLNDESRCAELRMRGSARLAQFTPTGSASALADAYGRVPITSDRRR